MAIKLKRGTTESWALGPELVDFGQSSTKGKDSIIRAEGTELEMYVYTTSANEWWTKSPSMGGQSTGKIPGLPIYVNGEREPGQATGEGAARCTLKIYFEAPADCTLEYINGVGGLYRPQFTNYEYIDTNYQQGSGNFPELFIKWPAEKVGTAEPVPIKIRVSLRENWLCEELEEGQLGLEYTEDGHVKVKAGVPGTSKWDELPYIGTQADWSVADESYPEAIKNKPFGHVIYIGEVVNNHTSCSEPMEGAGVVIGGYNPTNMKPNTPYDIWLNDNYLGTHFSNQLADIDIEGIVGLMGGTLVIYGTSTPGSYHILVYGIVEEDRKIDSIYLNTYGDLYGGEPNDPVSCQVVRELASNFGSSLASLQDWQGAVSQDLSSLDAALDAIIAIQKELIGVTLITFLIAGAEYQAEEGMTWGDLVGSEYDPDNRVVIQPGGFAGFKTGETTIWNIMNENGDLEYESDIIRDGHLYDLD